MSALFWKDVRLNRTVLVVTGALIALPYLVAIAFALNESYAASMPIHRSWPNLILAANHFCLMHWPVAAALLGGNAFACERADRSAEFLAYLPPTKRLIASSKFAVVLVVAAIFWGLNLLLFWFSSAYIGDDTFQYLDMSEAAPKSTFAAIGVLTFGVGWLASSVMTTTGPAVVSGLCAPIGLFALLQLTTWWLGWPPEGDYGEWFASISLSAGLLAVLGGWQIYLNRVEP